MKKTSIAILSVFICLFVACRKDLGSKPTLSPDAGPLNSATSLGGDRDEEGGSCEEKTVPLMAGQSIQAGTVTIANDDDFIYVTYTTTGGWVLTKTHLFVGACTAIPVNNGGNAVPGQFPYKTTHSNVTSYTYTLPVSAIGINVCGCMAAHANVKKLSPNGQTLGSETGWGQGDLINAQGNWAMKVSYCPVPCN